MYPRSAFLDLPRKEPKLSSHRASKNRSLLSNLQDSWYFWPTKRHSCVRSCVMKLSGRWTSQSSSRARPVCCRNSLPSRPQGRPRSFDTIHCRNLWQNWLCSSVCRCSARLVQTVCNDTGFWACLLLRLLMYCYYWILAAPATGPTLEVADSLYDKIFDTNVKSFWSFTQEVLPHLQPFANFVFISSVGAYDPAPPLGLYGVSKTALIGLTKLLANELGHKGIRVNCIAPGIIRTRFSEMLWRPGPDGKLPMPLKRWTDMGYARSNAIATYT